jgi:hypothetical protein
VAFLEVSIRWHRDLGFWFTFLLFFLLGFGLLEKLSLLLCWVKKKLCVEVGHAKGLHMRDHVSVRSDNFLYLLKNYLDNISNQSYKFGNGSMGYRSKVRMHLL